MKTNLSAYFNVNEKGMIVPNYSTIKEDIISDFKNYIFTDSNGVIDTTTETSVGRLIAYLATVFSGILDLSAQTINQFNINYASGNALDTIGSWFNINRKQGTPAVITCILNGTPNTVIPMGMVLSIYNNIFTLSNSVTINETGNGIGTFVSEKIGVINIDKISNEDIKIASVIEGLDSVEATSNITNGSSFESDFAYRNRIKASAWIGVGFKNVILNGILSVDNVISASILENYTSSESVNINGVVLPSHSIFICVYGGDDNDVADAIIKTKPVGCGYMQSLVASGGTDDNLVKIDIASDNSSIIKNSVYFFRPTISYINSIDISASNYSSNLSDDELRTAFSDIIVEYFNDNIDIGESVSAFQIASYIQSKIDGIAITNIQIKDSQNNYVSSINAKGNELLRVLVENINSTISKP
jgi:uncharacterized phage protein gp47/JayE